MVVTISFSLSLSLSLYLSLSLCPSLSLPLSFPLSLSRCSERSQGWGSVGIFGIVCRLTPTLPAHSFWAVPTPPPAFIVARSFGAQQEGMGRVRCGGRGAWGGGPAGNMFQQVCLETCAGPERRTGGGKEPSTADRLTHAHPLAHSANRSRLADLHKITSLSPYLSLSLSRFLRLPSSQWGAGITV